MNIEYLEHFLVVARLQNISKAAELLYIGHSTLSRHVAALEQELGVQLLIRDNRSVQLTRAGKYVLDKGPGILKSLEEFEFEAKRAGSDVSGYLSLASLSFYSPELFATYKDFHLSYPDIDFVVSNMGMGEICDSVLRGASDVGITFSFELPDSLQQVNIMSLYKESFCLITHSDHPLSNREVAFSHDIKNENFLGINNLRVDFIRRVQERAGIFNENHNRVNEPASLESLILQVKAGMGIALLPYPVAVQYGVGCKILELGDFDTTFDVVMLWSKSNRKAELDMLKSAVRKKFITGEAK